MRNEIRPPSNETIAMLGNTADRRRSRLAGLEGVATDMIARCN